jgi:hypothetical protein
LLTLLLAVITVSAGAQSVAAPALKAAFLYNLAKFTEWPADALPAGASLVLCATDAPVAAALAVTAGGRSIGGHSIEVRLLNADSSTLRECHLMYVGDLGRKAAGPLLDALKGAPMLTVGDREEFVQLGGIAQLFIEDGQMRFAISVESAQRARLQLSAKLLSLARIY